MSVFVELVRDKSRIYYGRQMSDDGVHGKAISKCRSKTHAYINTSALDEMKWDEKKERKTDKTNIGMKRGERNEIMQKKKLYRKIDRQQTNENQKAVQRDSDAFERVYRLLLCENIVLLLRSRAIALCIYNNKQFTIHFSHSRPFLYHTL